MQLVCDEASAPQNTLQQKSTTKNKFKCKIMQISKTHCLAKPNVSGMQNPNRANVTAATKTLKEASLQLPGHTATH